MTTIYDRLQACMRICVYTLILAFAGALNLTHAENLSSTELRGRIVYHGQIPPLKTEVIEHDIETCGKIHQIIPVAVSDDGGLAQVVVSVDGMSGTPFSLQPDPLIIENDKCRFLPHIALGSVKQLLEVQNSDGILHNTHIRTETRAFFNVVLLPQSNGIRKIMKQPGLMTITCNKHPFMVGYIQVFDHPYFAITDPQGTFTIPNLPTGTHRLTIWHKTLGTIHRTLTIPQKTNAILDIVFAAH